MTFSSIRRSRCNRLISLCLVITFAVSMVITPRAAYAQESVMGLPQPGAMVNLSTAYVPLMITGLTVHPENPLLMDFIVSTGNSGLNAAQVKKESDRLIKYFLACLTIPENNQWVNLSPYEKDRIIPDDLGQTVLGRDMLEQDYILKQLTASLIYPERNLGKSFWDEVYAKASQMYGTTQIPVNTFNKVWILPDTAKVFEHNNTVFVVKSHLRVMLDEDYLSLSKHSSRGFSHTSFDLGQFASLRGAEGDEAISSRTNSLGNQVVRQIILPAIEREVNNGKNFAQLRQIYNSVILAVWFKKNLREALLNQVYTDKSKVNGVNVDDPAIKEKIYRQYLEAYKKGVFNYIKEETDPNTQETIPRKYFSGGLEWNVTTQPATPQEVEAFEENSAAMTVYDIHSAVGPASGAVNPSAAMTSQDVENELNAHKQGLLSFMARGEFLYGAAGVARLKAENSDISSVYFVQTNEHGQFYKPVYKNPKKLKLSNKPIEELWLFQVQKDNEKVWVLLQMPRKDVFDSLGAGFGAWFGKGSPEKKETEDAQKAAVVAGLNAVKDKKNIILITIEQGRYNNNFRNVGTLIENLKSFTNYPNQRIFESQLGGVDVLVVTFAVSQEPSFSRSSEQPPISSVPKTVRTPVVPKAPAPNRAAPQFRPPILSVYQTTPEAIQGLLEKIEGHYVIAVQGSAGKNTSLMNILGEYLSGKRSFWGTYNLVKGKILAKNYEISSYRRWLATLPVALQFGLSLDTVDALNQFYNQSSEERRQKMQEMLNVLSGDAANPKLTLEVANKILFGIPKMIPANGADYKMRVTKPSEVMTTTLKPGESVTLPAPSDGKEISYTIGGEEFIFYKGEDGETKFYPNQEGKEGVDIYPLSALLSTSYPTKENPIFEAKISTSKRTRGQIRVINPKGSNKDIEISFANTETAEAVLAPSAPQKSIPNPGGSGVEIPLKPETSAAMTVETRTIDPKVRKAVFGTSGDRGRIDINEDGKDANGKEGADFNIGLVEKDTKGIAEHLIAENEKNLKEGKPTKKTVIIGYDTRHRNPEFSRESARIMAAYGFKVIYIAKGPIPTPVLAYLTSVYDDVAGVINFTASHSPHQDGGIKFSPFHGGAADNETTKSIEGFANSSDQTYKIADYQEAVKEGAIIELEPQEAVAKYVDDYLIPILKTTRGKDGRSAWEDIVDYIKSHPNFKLIVDPFQGTGVDVDRLLCQRMAKDVGRDFYEIIHTNNKDPFFREVGGAPQPAGNYIKGLVDAVKADPNAFGMAQDGDVDRFGVVDKGGEQIIANQMMALFAWFLKNDVGLKGYDTVVKTVATSDFIVGVANRLGLKVIEVPVGFKYIVDQVIKGRKVLVGGEESSHVGLGPFMKTWDDGFVVGLTALWMLAKTGKTLGEYRDAIEQQIGMKYVTEVKTLRDDVNDKYRKDVDLKIAAYNQEVSAGVPLSQRTFVASIEQEAAKHAELNSPKVVNVNTMDGLKLSFDNGDSILMRKSGTEPAAKWYVEVSNPGRLGALFQVAKVFMGDGAMIHDSTEVFGDDENGGSSDFQYDYGRQRLTGTTTKVVGSGVKKLPPSIVWNGPKLTSGRSEHLPSLRGGAAGKSAAMLPGGIDLNSRNLNLQSEGRKINITFDPAMIAQFRRGDFSGVRIQILDVVPIDLMPLLGLRENEGQLAKA